MQDGRDVTSPDLFYTEVVNRYVGGARFLRRDWLEHKVEEALRLTDRRFVLVRGAPGAGKSAFLAQLAADHPDWLRYFIRFDQREAVSDVSATSMLLDIAIVDDYYTRQLAALRARQVYCVARGGTVWLVLVVLTYGAAFFSSLCKRSLQK